MSLIAGGWAWMPCDLILDKELTNLVVEGALTEGPSSSTAPARRRVPHTFTPVMNRFVDGEPGPPAAPAVPIYLQTPVHPLPTLFISLQIRILITCFEFPYNFGLLSLLIMVAHKSFQQQL